MDPRIVQFTANQLLAVYVQAGSLNQFDVDQVLADARIMIGDYRVRHLADLVRLSFLLSKATRQFIEHLAEHLQLLRASSHREFTTLDGHVRGAVNWAQTVPLQVTRPASFVCADPRRSFDLPENRMLRALVDSLAVDLGRVTSRWPGEETGWRKDLRRMHDRLAHVRANPYYRQIPAGAGASAFVLPPRLIERVRRRRSPLAALVLKQFLAYRRVCGDRPDRQEVYRCLRDGLRWPDENKLFELFTLFALTQLLRGLADGRPELVPIQARASGDRWFACLKAADVEIRVYYQNVPSDLRITYAAEDADPSIRDYASALQRYGVSPGSLRPDVVIDCRRPGRRRLLLVEVKNSNNLNTIGQGLRELVDYRHLLRSRNGDLHGVERSGLLAVRGLPPGMRIVDDPATLPQFEAITTAQRLLDYDQMDNKSAELTRFLRYCWFL